MSSGLVFITGATGFIGSAVAIKTLQAGYSLRISVRKEEQIPKLKAALSEYEDRIEFVITPDITQPSSFAGKLDGAKYVLHVASPMPHGTNPETYFGPAVMGTTTILKEAAKVSSIKKVVITSSIAALIPMSGRPEGGVIKENNDWDLSVDQTADLTGANNEATSMNLYHASKLLANQASWDFKKTENPTFSLVTLHPAFVFGRNALQTTAEDLSGTNGLFFLTVADGKPLINITAVHIDDVAEAHVKALADNIPDRSSYLLAGKKNSWKDVAEVVKKEYPHLGFKISNDISGESWPVDTTKAEAELGMQWRSLEQMTRDVIDQQIELRSKGNF
ncbi:3-beta hydroxysteroid dehydrogenase/isomerase family protein [Aspergillus eucalypticola CBS 122712]|uniref:3-beta hydroxysteroid dehydrogenase/isomerase family protein n=1 Tax=Aspergillus eucalypticola (strain CBS 122712 / IBT 29274) TaxID=1448314 RepID=A0A317V5N5_ASPEC|nr:3-beta hydroxysteroid dehydrogenase/isomerase family protein [Aspergillus eucalypticola CBS 122712]PWY68217.1 3-beta hydroxysteroid dehydrogenase/isomerase family protein [Aspergillus eucalypticola CBS 122712]